MLNKYNSESITLPDFIYMNFSYPERSIKRSIKIMRRMVRTNKNKLTLDILDKITQFDNEYANENYHRILNYFINFIRLKLDYNYSTDTLLDHITWIENRLKSLLMTHTGSIDGLPVVYPFLVYLSQYSISNSNYHQRQLLDRVFFCILPYIHWFMGFNKSETTLDDIFEMAYAQVPGIILRSDHFISKNVTSNILSGPLAYIHKSTGTRLHNHVSGFMKGENLKYWIHHRYLGEYIIVNEVDISHSKGARADLIILRWYGNHYRPVFVIDIKSKLRLIYQEDEFFEVEISEMTNFDDAVISSIDSSKKQLEEYRSQIRSIYRRESLGDCDVGSAVLVIDVLEYDKRKLIYSLVRNCVSELYNLDSETFYHIDENNIGIYIYRKPRREIIPENYETIVNQIIHPKGENGILCVSQDLSIIFKRLYEELGPLKILNHNRLLSDDFQLRDVEFEFVDEVDEETIQLIDNNLQEDLKGYCVMRGDEDIFTSTTGRHCLRQVEWAGREVRYYLDRSVLTLTDHMYPEGETNEIGDLLRWTGLSFDDEFDENMSNRELQFKTRDEDSSASVNEIHFKIKKSVFFQIDNWKSYSFKSRIYPDADYKKRESKQLNYLKKCIKTILSMTPVDGYPKLGRYQHMDQQPINDDLVGLLHDIESYIKANNLLAIMERIQDFSDSRDIKNLILAEMLKSYKMLDDQHITFRDYQLSHAWIYLILMFINIEDRVVVRLYRQLYPHLLQLLAGESNPKLFPTLIPHLLHLTGSVMREDWITKRLTAYFVSMERYRVLLIEDRGVKIGVFTGGKLIRHISRLPGNVGKIERVEIITVENHTYLVGEETQSVKYSYSGDKIEKFYLGHSNYEYKRNDTRVDANKIGKLATNMLRELFDQQSSRVKVQLKFQTGELEDHIDMLLETVGKIRYYSLDALIDVLRNNSVEYKDQIYHFSSYTIKYGKLSFLRKYVVQEKSQVKFTMNEIQDILTQPRETIHIKVKHDPELCEGEHRDCFRLQTSSGRHPLVQGFFSRPILKGYWGSEVLTMFKTGSIIHNDESYLLDMELDTSDPAFMEDPSMVQVMRRVTGNYSLKKIEMGTSIEVTMDLIFSDGRFAGVVFTNPITHETKRHELSMLDECDYIADLEKLLKEVDDKRLDPYRGLVPEHGNFCFVCAGVEIIQKFCGFILKKVGDSFLLSLKYKVEAIDYTVELNEGVLGIDELLSTVESMKKCRPSHLFIKYFNVDLILKLNIEELRQEIDEVEQELLKSMIIESPIKNK